MGCTLREQWGFGQLGESARDSCSTASTGGSMHRGGRHQARATGGGRGEEWGWGWPRGGFCGHYKQEDRSAPSVPRNSIRGLIGPARLPILIKSRDSWWTATQPVNSFTFAACVLETEALPPIASPIEFVLPRLAHRNVWRRPNWGVAF